MNAIHHELIRASAGTGKTFQLTNRYLTLLFATGKPERIIALTFTRKAAGEFFSKIFQRLADGAEGTHGAAKLSRELGLSVDPDSCRTHLRLLLEQLHKLQLSTYDTFFSRIVQSFPFELGLAAAPTLLSNDERAVQIQRAQQALSRRTIADSHFLADFWHACKRATMGVESKTITEIVSDFIKENHSLFFDAADRALWGDEGQIWRGHSPWSGPEVDVVAEAKALRDVLSWSTLKPKQKIFWEEYINQLEGWKPPAGMPKRVESFTGKFLEVFDSLDSGGCQVTIQSKQSLSKAEGEIVKRITRHCFATMLKPRLEATKGIFDIVRLFEEIYSVEVRRAGRITLEDATRLLAGSNVHGQGLSDPELREKLGYRLDGSFDHWLLDEFQDTSRVQWKAIAQLLDEVLQDPEKQRSFFAVGDTKQSIYGWRGSDDRLFDRVHRQYESVLTVRALSESYRSVPAVLAMVNEVFGKSTEIAEITSTSVAARWSPMWTEHTSSESTRNLSGYSCLIHAPGDDPDCFATALSLLKALNPLERGLSVAVLTRENDTADALVEFLRENGGPACSLAANVRPGKDSIVAAGLRSLMTLAAHPADTQAWLHLRMSPMGKQLEDRFPSAIALSKHLLEIWSASGLVGVVDYWSILCRAHVDTADGFNLGRLELCRNAAAALDGSGESDIDSFVRGLDGIELREHDTPGQVAVMTVHKAKGLDWDIVIVTDLAGRTLSERRKSGLAVQRDDNGEVEWICDLPSSDLAASDRVLGAKIQASKDDAAFERLCALYVAMTRAERGLYVVTHSAEGTSKNYHRLLDTTLAANPREISIGGTPFVSAWQNGDLDWFQESLSAPYTDANQLAVSLIPENERRTDRRPKAIRPSETDTGGWRLLLGGRSESLDFGSAVHHALAKVEWLGDSPTNDASLIDSAVEGLSGEAEASVRLVLTASDARAVFVRTNPRMEVWREMPFEWVSNGEWVTGRFDRVVIEKSDAGLITSALLVDFKTAGKERKIEVNAFESQMGFYKEALAALCGLEPSAVDAKVVLLQPGRVEVRSESESRRDRPAAFDAQPAS